MSYLHSTSGENKAFRLVIGESLQLTNSFLDDVICEPGVASERAGRHLVIESASRRPPLCNLFVCVCVCVCSKLRRVISSTWTLQLMQGKPISGDSPARSLRLTHPPGPDASTSVPAIITQRPNSETSRTLAPDCSWEDLVYLKYFSHKSILINSKFPFFCCFFQGQSTQSRPSELIESSKHLTQS